MNRSSLLVALLALGCPSPNGESAPPTKTTTVTAPAPPAPATEPDAPSPGPMGPPGTPRPEDGRHQLDLLQRRRIVVGGVPVTAYIADTYDRRRLGLMHVRELPTDHGMLFIYPDARELGFWMKNTFIPLSIAYIAADGRIDSILDMEPHVERSHPSRGVVRFALEMPRGWFREHRIDVGARVDGIVSMRGYE